MTDKEKLEEIKETWNAVSPSMHLLRIAIRDIDFLIKQVEESQELKRKLQLVYENSDLDNDAKIDHLGYELGYDTNEEDGDPYEPTPPNEYGM